MSLGSYLVARAARLSPREGRAIRERDIFVPMRDGVRLRAEWHHPARPGTYPTLLMRVPYGFRGFGSAATAFAERGYNVLIEAVRGTGGSEGQFDPLTHERDDGLDTLDWIKAQPWFDGRLGTTGPSYLGYAQWAICDALPPQSAMSIKVSSAEFRSIVFPGGGFHLGLWLGWMQIIEGLRGNPWRFARKMSSGHVEQQTLAASMTLPLIDADKRATGHVVPFWKRWLGDAIGSDTFWEPLDHTHRIGTRTPPASFVSGWYDFMLDQLLRDYASMVDAGRPVRLKIGPWTHVSPELQYESIRDTLDWMDIQLRGRTPPHPAPPVRLWISGLEAWRDFEAFPPGPPEIDVWLLQPDRQLSRRAAASSPPDRYIYDPRKPTPSVGGAMFALTGIGPVDQAPLEARSDVLTYTSEPLIADTTIIGSARAVIYARGSLPDADIFVKLSDVDPSGRSINICDGILRKTLADPAEPDNIWKLSIKLHATAHCFRAGHRLRLLVASGAHPRFARNLGTSEPVGTATHLRTLEMEIFHDPERPSAIHLPVYDLRESRVR